MRALTLDYGKHQLIERDVPNALISAPDEVLIRVHEVGVCGTDRDLAAFKIGRPPEDSDHMVLGHEALGQVVEVGSAVQNFSPGDWVVPTVRRACAPPCASCSRGRRDLCLSGAYRERGILGAHGYISELAVDKAEDVVPIPASCQSNAILIEPLSVVEKAVELAFELHQGEPRTALVVGAGTIGLLAALAMRLRGLHVTVFSQEAATSDRARLVQSADCEYTTQTSSKYDFVIEAAGAPEASDAALDALGALGVLILLGASSSQRPVPWLNLILQNQIVAGSVNASPSAFRRAVEDLGRFPDRILESMIEREPLDRWQTTFSGERISPRPKTVFVL